MEGFYRKTGNGAADPPAAVRSAPSALSFGAVERNQAQEQEWMHRIHARLLEVVDLSLITGIEEKQAKGEIREVANRLMNEESAPLNAPSRQRVIKQIEDEILALGPLEPLLADLAVTDILVNGCEAVYVERGGKLERVAVHFKDDAHVLGMIDRIVSRVGRRIDESCPMVDARLKDGSRINAIIPPLAIDGPTLSIRRFPKERLRAEDLVRIGSVSEPMVAVLQAVVKAKLNVLVSGGTGSGKPRY